MLGLLDLNEPATPYDLKQFAKTSVFRVWPLPHSQIYSECARLTEAGILAKAVEEGGRHRRFYKLTARGRKALERWRGEPTERTYEGRSLPALKLFLGTDPVALGGGAVARAPAAAARLEAASRTRRCPRAFA